LLGENWVLKKEGKNLDMEYLIALLPCPLSCRFVVFFWVEINI